MEPIKYSSHISSEDLQRRFDEIHTLLAQAFRKNQELQQKLQVQDLALKAMAQSIRGAASSAGEFLRNQSFSYSNGTDRVAQGTFFENVVWLEDTEVDSASGILSLRSTTDISRVPLTDTRELSILASVIINNGTYVDPTVKWILEPDRFWCNSFQEDSIDISISLPPTLTSEANYIAIENLFPNGIFHTVQYFDIHGNAHVINQKAQERSWVYPINGKYFGGRIIIKLKSTLQVDGQWVFGLRNVRIGYRTFTGSGYAVTRVDFNHTDGGDLNLRSFKASYILPVEPHQISEVLQFQIGTAYDTYSHDISGIIYDSTTHPFPMTTSDTAINATSVPNTVYVKTILKENGSSPMVEGFYFEFNEA